MPDIYFFGILEVLVRVQSIFIAFYHKLMYMINNNIIDYSS